MSAPGVLHVTHRDRTAKVRLADGVPLARFLEQLVASTQIGLPVGTSPLDYQLRLKSSNEPLSEANYSAVREAGTPLKLCPSAAVQARQMILSLSPGAEDRKMATFSLQKSLIESDFRTAFLEGGGLASLCHIVMSEEGNTLAYALGALGSLLAFESIEQDLAEELLPRVVQHAVDDSPLNVIRPATTVLSLLLRSPSTSLLALSVLLDLAPDCLVSIADRLSAADVNLAMITLALLLDLFRTGDRKISQGLSALGLLDVLRSLSVTLEGKEMDESTWTSIKSRILASLHPLPASPLTPKYPTIPAFATLHSALSQQSYNFIASQRLNSLYTGAWFTNSRGKSQYFRLAPGGRSLEWIESDKQRSVDKSEVFANSHLSTLVSVRRPSPLSISLSLASSTVPLLASDVQTASEWMDALSLLLGDPLSTIESLELVDSLTEIELHVKLLDLTGERQEVVFPLATPVPPAVGAPFYYSEL